MALPTYSTGGDLSASGGFAERFPSLVANPTPTATQQTWITDRLAFWWSRHNATFWGTDRTEATLLAVADEWQAERKRLGGSEATGELTSQSVGDWSESYEPASDGASTVADSALADTDYGRDLLRLRQGRMGRFSRVSQ